MRACISWVAYFISALAISCGISGEAFAQTGRLHAILAIDSLSPDIAPDMKANEYWYSVCFQNNVPDRMLNMVTLDGHKLSQSNVLTVIRNLNVGDDDAVVFYYSGHGFYDNERGTFIVPKADQNVRFYRSTVEAAIQAKRPRLCVTVFDCCSVGPKGPKGVFAPAPQPVDVVSPLFDSLFFTPRGTVTLVSSAPGEYALCHIPLFSDDRRPPDAYGAGSLFTNEMTSLLGSRADERLGWETVCPILRNKVSHTFRRIAKGGMITLSGGGVLTQKNQTVVARLDGNPL